MLKRSQLRTGKRHNKNKIELSAELLLCTIGADLYEAYPHSSQLWYISIADNVNKYVDRLYNLYKSVGSL